MIRPIYPFSWGFLPRKPLAQHEDSALRVLSFFCSPQAHRLMWLSTMFLLFLGAGFWPVLHYWKPTAEPAGLLLRAIVAFIFWYGFFILTIYLHFVLLARYALKHWEQVQRDYEPWPVDEPYELLLRERWHYLLAPLRGSTVKPLLIPRKFRDQNRTDRFTFLWSTLGLSTLLLLDRFVWHGRFHQSAHWAIWFASGLLMTYAWRRQRWVWCGILGGVVLLFNPFPSGVLTKKTGDLLDIAIAVILPIVAWGIERPDRR